MKASLVILILILECFVVDCFLVCTENIIRCLTRRRGPIIYAAKDADDEAIEITATKIVETTKIPSKTLSSTALLTMATIAAYAFSNLLH